MVLPFAWGESQWNRTPLAYNNTIDCKQLPYRDATPAYLATVLGETMSEEVGREEDGTLTSESLAALIVDTLAYVNIVQKQDVERAITITTEEINVRKAAGDY
jgi:hypothetical protein